VYWLKTDRRFLFAVLFAVVGLCPTCLWASDLSITKSWIRATIGQGNVTAGYFTIENLSDQQDRLVAVRTSVAGKTEVHTTLMGDGGVMRMRPVEVLDVPAGGKVALKPGGDHLMLMGIANPLKDGAMVLLELEFEQAGTVLVEAPVSRQEPYP